MLEAMLRKLVDVSPKVRASAIDALVKILDPSGPYGPAQLWDVIELGLNDPDAHVKMQAAHALFLNDIEWIPKVPEGMRPSMEDALVANASGTGKYCQTTTIRAIGAWTMTQNPKFEPSPYGLPVC